MLVRFWKFPMMPIFRDTRFVFQKNTKPQNKPLHGIVWNSEILEYSEHSDILLRDVKGEHSAKRTKRCNKGTKMQEWKSWIILADPNYEIFLILTWIKKLAAARFTHSDTRPCFIVRSATQTAWQVNNEAFEVVIFIL